MRGGMWLSWLHSSEGPATEEIIVKTASVRGGVCEGVHEIEVSLSILPLQHTHTATLCLIP